MLKRKFAPRLNLPGWTYSMFDQWLDYEPVETEWVKSVVKPGMICYDCGAHFGHYSALLSKLVGPTGKVYAFEPDPDNRAKLESKVAKLGNVTILGVAIGDTIGEVRLIRNGQDAQSKVRATGEGISVPLVTLDSLKLPRPDFLKADIEGYELHMLRGMSFSPRYVLLELFPDCLRDAGTKPEDVLKELERRNYSIDKAKWQLHDNLLCTLKGPART
jgi:FkbM family methyltransferase